MKYLSYSTLASEAKKITLNSKWLWIYGLVLSSTAFSGGNYGSNFDNSGLENLQELESTNDVLGASTEVLGTTSDMLLETIAGLPPRFWLFAAIGILLAVALGVIIAVILKNWATGGLIGGIREAQAGEYPTLSSSSAYGRLQLKELIVFKVKIVLIQVGIIIFTLIAAGVLIAIAENVWVTVAALIPALLVLIIALVVFPMIAIYGERFIVLDGKSSSEAFDLGFEAMQNHFMATLRIGLFNIGIAFAVTMAAGILTLIILLVPFFLLTSSDMSVGWAILSVSPIALIAILAMTGIQAIVNVFKNAVWNLHFDHIYSNEE